MLTLYLLSVNITVYNNKTEFLLLCDTAELNTKPLSRATADARLFLGWGTGIVLINETILVGPYREGFSLGIELHSCCTTVSKIGSQDPVAVLDNILHLVP